MNNKKPIDTLTWKKDDQYVTIEKTYHNTTYIDRKTGKETLSTKQVDKIPPIERKRKRKQKQK